MEKGLLTINEASSLSGKSPQTIRRLLKQKKLKFRRKRTPQGFSYFIDRSSIADYFDLDSADQTSEISAESGDHVAAKQVNNETTQGNDTTLQGHRNATQINNKAAQGNDTTLRGHRNATQVNDESGQNYSNATQVNDKSGQNSGKATQINNESGQNYGKATQVNDETEQNSEKSSSASSQTKYGFSHGRNDELNGLNRIPMEDIIEIDANADFEYNERDQASSVFSQPLSTPHGESSVSSGRSAQNTAAGNRAGGGYHSTGYGAGSNPAQETAQYSIDFNKTILQLINQYDRILSQQEEDKRKLFKLLEDFQERVISLESRIKQLEAPKKKKWFHVF
ncbi:helix-turn-helix domain-containing protein [Candidatus Peregrinibacteria bacterium]|nr:helix-turn-helix domain-containing protein [Candidatus Peregrinibacteria bacterium]